MGVKNMRNKNICKFIVSDVSENLSVSSFILESDKKIMSKYDKFKRHRVFLVTKGEGNFKFANEKIPFSPGGLLFVFKDEFFSVESEEDCEYMYISFDGNRAEELFRRFNIVGVNRYFSGYDGLIPLWRESLSRAGSQTIDLASESILLYTFSRLSVNTDKFSGIINKMIEISEEHFRDPELSINTVAEMLSYNPKYISHIFKEKMRLGYSEYLRTLRIKYAVSLFEHGIDSVKNVAILSGFTDPLYFSTVFKKVTGASPKDYKIKLNNSQNDEK